MCSWIRTLNNGKMLILSKLTYRFSIIPIKILVGFFKIEIGKLILNFIWKHKRSRIAKTKQTKTKILIKKIKLED